jgi:SSS family solute:Na+ symporter
MVIISWLDEKRGKKSNGLEVDGSMFKMNPAFLAGIVLVLGIITALYTIFW